MTTIEIKNHKKFPNDPYTKEAAYVVLDGGKSRALWVRKQAKNGGMYWTIPSIGVVDGTDKNYLETFIQDSMFLDKDIRAQLEELSKKDELPF